jgi:uncharacterized membrane protein
MAELKDLKKTGSKAMKSAAKKPAGLAAAGVALAAVPMAAEKLGGLVRGKASDAASNAGDKAKEKAKEAVGEMTPDKGLLSGGGLLSGIFGGGGDSDDEGEDGAGKGSAAPGFGSGRRMPIQQSVDVAVPVRQAYDAWTRFEDWPDFMHRLESVQQVDDATVAFQAKIWGVKKRFEADILEQRPDQRIEWDVTEGFAHTGVVTFHELSDRLTRIEVTLDIEPDSLVEKASRGMRFVKRAVRGDLHRFKAYIELEQEPDKGWRGTIEDGRVKRRPSSGQRGNGSGSNGSSRGSSSRSKAGAAS